MPALLFILIVFHPHNVFSQVQRIPHGVLIDSNSIKLRDNLQYFNSKKHSNLDSSYFWVMNAECKPIENARIILSNYKGFSDTFTTHSYDGLYFIKTPTVGVYKIEVEAQGYEKQMQHIQLNPHGRLRKRIALGKPGDFYLPTPMGFFPLSSPLENVSFELADSYYSDSSKMASFILEFWKEIKKLRRIADPSDTNHIIYDTNIHWPTDSAKRSEFRKAIEESQYLKTYKLQYVLECAYGANGIDKTLDFMINELVDEKTIRSVLESNNFGIYRIRKTLDKNWIITTNYNAPMSRDIFTDIQKINQALPMIWVILNSYGCIEHSNRR